MKIALQTIILLLHKHWLKVSALLVVASVLATAAMAQTINPERIQPGGPMPPTPENRTGLPPAPPDIIRGPGSGSRGLTGNDTPDPTTPPPTVVRPKDDSRAPKL